MIRPATMVDRMKRNMEIPADFMAASSKRSPRLPYNMMEDSRVASGRARESYWLMHTTTAFL